MQLLCFALMDTSSAVGVAIYHVPFHQLILRNRHGRRMKPAQSAQRATSLSSCDRRVAPTLKVERDRLTFSREHRSCGGKVASSRRTQDSMSFKVSVWVYGCSWSRFSLRWFAIWPRRLPPVSPSRSSSSSYWASGDVVISGRLSGAFSRLRRGIDSIVASLVREEARSRGMVSVEELEQVSDVKCFDSQIRFCQRPCRSSSL